jgi:putative transposase
VNYLVSNNVTTLVVGYNKGWKQNTSMSKQSNQNFVQIPFYRFLEMLSYKCRLNGIELVLQEESYTSKCSFFDGETVCKQNKYLGVRVKRGLFKTAKGYLVNADVNGSLNILRKYLETKVAWNSNLILDYVEACSEPVVMTIKLNKCA